MTPITTRTPRNHDQRPFAPRFRQTALSFAALAVALACLPAHAASRAYVSSTGSDARRPTCALSTPCRTFQVAHNVVDAGGEILALDTGDYGLVTITKSVSILGSPGAIAGITVGGGSGVTIATPGIDVVLRNLKISGTGANGALNTTGIDMIAGKSLAIENCILSSHAVGARISTAADVRIIDSVMRGNVFHGASLSEGATVDIVNSRFTGNGASGVYIGSASNSLTSVSFSDSVASGNGDHGFAAVATSGNTNVSLIRSTASHNGGAGFHNESASMNARARMSVGSSMATGNAIGFFNSPHIPIIQFFETLGNNLVRWNVTDVVGVILPPSGQ